MRNRQRGVACIGCLLGAVIVIGLAIGGLGMIKAFMKNMEIRTIFQSMAKDSELLNQSDTAIRLAFAKRATVAEIGAITPEEVMVRRDQGGLVLSADYTVNIPIAGNVSMQMHFTPSSDK
jgi:hypothetical protein